MTDPTKPDAPLDIAQVCEEAALYINSGHPAIRGTIETTRVTQLVSDLLRAAERVRELQAERDRLTQWVDDLQSGMYVNCVYCGHRYGPGDTTPVSMADALKAHIERCPLHPISALRAERDRLKEALGRKGEGR